MDRRRFRIAYLLLLVLLLAAGADARRISAFDGTDERYRVFADRIGTRLMKGLVFDTTCPTGKTDVSRIRSLPAYVSAARRTA